MTKRKLLTYFIYIFCFIFVLCIGFFTYFYISTKNSITGRLQLNGLTGKVNIAIDAHGIPHIDALSNDHDAFFALGYIHAQDRLWQMEFQRHIVKGTLSEIFGEATIEQDKYLRKWGFYYAAKAAWLALDSLTQSFVHSYTLGINAFLKQGNLPLELKIVRYRPEPWTDIDSIAWQKMMAWNLQNSWEDKLINDAILKLYGSKSIKILQPPYPDTGPTVLTQEELSPLLVSEKTKEQSSYFKKIESINDTLKTTKAIRKQLGFEDIPGKGSNAWVVSGKLTESGKPILANDPHLQFSAPILWYLAELSGPTLHVMGATIPGLPFVIIGHNDFIGWGVTDAAVDAQDLYIEPSDATFTIREEKINIRNKTPLLFRVKSSIHGPIINEISDTTNALNAAALKWPALMPGDTTVKSFMLLNYANNWEKFNNALQWHVAPALNFLYADSLGNIGFTLAGKIPKRTKKSELPISTHESNDWVGYIPFEQLPRTFNPKKGYIVSANNKIVPDTYLYPLTFRWAANPYRASRIINLLQENKRISVGVVEKIQTDTMSLLWQDLRQLLLKTSPLDTLSQYALDQLATWDGVIVTNKLSPTIFAYWYKELNKLMPMEIAAKLQRPEAFFIKNQLQTDGTYCRTSTTQNCQQFLSVSLQQTMMKLKAQYGNNDKKWQWGKIHHAHFKLAALGDVNYLGWIWNRNIATDSGDDTVNVGSYDTKTLIHTEGAGYRQIIDFAQFEQSKYILALGQSGNVFSRHYDDQLQLWNNAQYLSIISSKLAQERMPILHLEPQ